MDCSSVVYWLECQYRETYMRLTRWPLCSLPVTVKLSNRLFKVICTSGHWSILWLCFFSGIFRTLCNVCFSSWLLFLEFVFTSTVKSCRYTMYLAHKQSFKLEVFVMFALAIFLISLKAILLLSLLHGTACPNCFVKSVCSFLAKGEQWPFLADHFLLSIK